MTTDQNKFGTKFEFEIRTNITKIEFNLNGTKKPNINNDDEEEYVYTQIAKFYSRTTQFRKLKEMAMKDERYHFSNIFKTIDKLSNTSLLIVSTCEDDKSQIEK